MESESAQSSPEAAVPVAMPQGPAPRRFGAAKAFVTFVGVNLAQILVGLGFGIAVVIVAAIRGANLQDPGELKNLTAQITLPLLFISPVVAILATLFFVRIWAWNLARDRSSSGLGLVAVSRRFIFIAGAVGVAGALAYLLFAHFVVPPKPGTQLGPVAAAAAAGPVSRGGWAFLAICLAPPVEEFLFRGMLLKGFATSWGIPAAATVVTILFVASHLFETIHYLPALIGISFLAIGALMFRLKTLSILPAIALHCGYNLVLVVAVPFV